MEDPLKLREASASSSEISNSIKKIVNTLTLLSVGGVKLLIRISLS